MMVDFLLKSFAILLIKLYQVFGRRLLRRTCLFHPSCSRRSLIFFKRCGFWKGLQLTRRQLSECRGNYSLRFNNLGAVEMITHSGRVIAEHNINPKIAMRLKQFQFNALDIV